MSDIETRDAHQERAPARLTRRALLNLRREEMRLRGEPADDMSQSAFSASSNNSSERNRQSAAIARAFAFRTPTSSMVRRKELQRQRQEAAGREILAEAAEQRRIDREAGRWTPRTPSLGPTEDLPPWCQEYKRELKAKSGPAPARDHAKPTLSGDESNLEASRPDDQRAFSSSSNDSRERNRQIAAISRAFALRTPTSSMIRRKELQRERQEAAGREILAEAAEQRRIDREAGRWTPRTPSLGPTEDLPPWLQEYKRDLKAKTGPAPKHAKSTPSSHKSDSNVSRPGDPRASTSEHRVSRDDGQAESDLWPKHANPRNQKSSRISGPGHRKKPRLHDTLGSYTDPAGSADALEGSDWRHSIELRELQDEMLEAAKFRPDTLYRTFDMKAFAEEPEKRGRANDDDALRAEGEPARSSAVPAAFPPHSTVEGMTELGAYLASSSYIVSLGGPPLPDLKYGIIIVPVGEEDLLFAGYGDHAGIPVELKEQISTKSRAIRKKQLAELRKKAAHEWAHGVPSEPEIDDDDRGFYRRRWRRRKGLPSDEGSERPAAATDDHGAVGQGEDDNKSRPNLTDVPASSHRQEGSQHSAHSQPSVPVSRVGSEEPADQDDLSRFAHEKQNAEYLLQDQPSRLASTSRAAMEAQPSRRFDEHGPEEENVSVREEAFTRSKGSRMTHQSADDHVPTTLPNTQVDGDWSRGGGQDGEKTSAQQDGPPASTPTTLQSAESRGKPLSPEACAALESLLGGEDKRRKGPHRVLHSLLARTRSKRSPHPAANRQDVLHEVSRALVGLVDDELYENPGIDQRIWETARKSLALKATP